MWHECTVTDRHQLIDNVMKKKIIKTAMCTKCANIHNNVIIIVDCTVT